MTRSGHPSKYYFILPVCTLITSCAVGPNFHSPEPPPTQVYNDIPLPKKTVKSKIKAGHSQYFALGKTIPNEWWKLFQSEALNCLIAQGLANNPSVSAGQAALRVAKENLFAQIGSTMLPSANAQAFVQRQRFSAAQFGDSNIDNIFTLYNTQVNVSYTLDIFGGNRRSIEALCALVDYQRFQLEGTYLTLSSNIATTAINEALIRSQIEATKTLVALQKEVLAMTKAQFELGSVSQLDVLTQESQLAQTLSLLPTLNKNLAFTRHALAALVGELPSEKKLPIFSLDELQLPPELPLSLPSTLVRRRPDVRAQEALLHQASAQIGVATANLLPQFTITGYYGWEADILSRLFTPTNNIWSIMGQVLQPIFQGGALFARRRAAIETYEQICAQYKQTVLQAFQNVADALRAIEIDALALKTQLDAENAAKKSFQLAQKQYQLGGTNYLTLLNAEQLYEQAILNRLQAQAQRFTDTAALFQALGGGWWQEGDA